LKLREVEQNFILLAIALIPLYLWSSGLPQISHLLVALSWLLRLLRGKLALPNILIFHILLALMVWMLVRQGFYGFSKNSLVVFMPPAYLIFNTFFLASISFLFSDNPDGRNPERIAIAVAAGAIVATGWIFAAGFSLVGSAQDLSRSVGSFNNPNQLGFYGLCLGGFAVMFFQTKTIRLWLFLLLFCIGGFMTILSLSKAAMISYAAYALIFLRGRQLLILASVCLAGMVIAPILNLSDFHFISRLQDIGKDSDDNLAERGYGIIDEMGLNVIWGFGEGYYHSISGDEIHSTLGNLLISYGLVGFLLFLAFQILLFVISFKSTRSLIISSFILLPYFLYGVTHNGFRFSSIWLLFGLIAFLKPQHARPRACSKSSIESQEVSLSLN
jgi:hypothetical protein